MAEPSKARKRAVRPRDAASLVLLRGPRGDPEVLLGRRPQSVRFMPGVYVFPGGAVDRTDHVVGSFCDYRQDVLARLTRQTRISRARALGWAAVRETWEETGVLIGRKGAMTASGNPARAAFAAEGLVPDLAALDYIARAVTPPHSPIRFNTRFFLADGTRRNAPLPHSDELEEIGWRKLAEVQGTLQMASVTHFVLDVALDHWLRRPLPDAARPVPLLSYRYRQSRIGPE